MNSTKHSFAETLVCSCLAILPVAAQAQEPGTADALFSNGVQAYFRGCSAEAESSFSSVMGLDPDDARAFYFRALSLMAQGRVDEARTDMQVGAQIEARVPNRFDIGKTLERVQGPKRLLLERYRSQARQAAATNPPRGAVRAPNDAVLREHRIVPLDEFSHPGQPRSVAAPVPSQETVKPLTLPITQPAQKSNDVPAGPVDPFNDDAAASGATPKAQPEVPPAKAKPPAKAPLPPQPKAAAPEPKPSVQVEKDDNPF